MQMDSSQINFVADILDTIQKFAKRHDSDGITEPYIMQIQIRQANKNFGMLIYNEAEEWVFEPEVDDE